ncbi:hypothetical protein ACOME3_006559 [Neoechinorhynchus agilis]
MIIRTDTGADVFAYLGILNTAEGRKLTDESRLLERLLQKMDPDRGERSIQRRLEEMSVARNPPGDPSNVVGGGTTGGEHGGRRRPRFGTELSEAFHVEDVDRLVDVGKSGVRVNVLSNFFTVEKVPSYKIFNYAVFFDPPCKSMFSMSKMVKMIARKHWENSVFSFSGQSVHLAHRIECEEHGDISYRGQVYNVRFQDTGETVPGTEPFVALLGLVLRGRLNTIGFRSINRNMFDMEPSARRDIEGFDMYPGIRSSILPRESGRLMLCIDRVNKVVNKQKVSALFSRVDINNEYGKKKLIDELVGNSLMTTYNNRFYRVMEDGRIENVNYKFIEKGRLFNIFLKYSKRLPHYYQCSSCDWVFACETKY